MSAKCCLMKGDSATVIGWGIGKGEGSCKLVHYLYEIRDLVILLDISFNLAPRDQNTLAGRFSSWGVALSSVFIDNKLLECCL